MANLWDAFKTGWSAPVNRSEIGQPKGVFKCRWCRKRLKVGARVCHHCNREQFPEVTQPPVSTVTASAEDRPATSGGAGGGGELKRRRADIDATLETLGYQGRDLIEARLRIVKSVVTDGRTVDEALDEEMIRAVQE